LTNPNRCGAWRLVRMMCSAGGSVRACGARLATLMQENVHEMCSRISSDGGPVMKL
jgi:hypothetical protein